MICDDLRETQFLVFEAGETCNLSEIHKKCPLHAGDRWRGGDIEEPMSDELIVNLAIRAHVDLGFSGIVCWHYYSEPCISIDRINMLAEAIREQVPQARFGLWTNGTIRVPEDKLRIFERAWISQYTHGEIYPEFRQAIKDIEMEPGVLDDRCTRRQGGNAPCQRPFIELVIDHRGYAHFCCVAYHADEALGNVQSEDFGEIVKRYNAVRRGISVQVDESAPTVCLSCGSRIDELYAKEILVAALLLVKDEIDILPTWWEHYRQLVDLIVVTDNGSLDGTREWLADRERDEPACIVIDEPATDYQQGAWTTRMMHIARQHGCRWVVPADADELWCPAGGKAGLRAILREHRDHRVIYVPSFVYRPTDADALAEPDPVRRLIYRDGTPDREWTKCLVRTDPSTRIRLGNHTADGGGDALLPGPRLDAHRMHICHYPERSWDHWRRKVICGGEMYEACSAKHPHGAGYHWRQPYAVYMHQGLAALWHLWRRDHVRQAAFLDCRQYHVPGEKYHESLFADYVCKPQEIKPDAQVKRAQNPPRSSLTPAVVMTHWSLPEKRLRDHLAWNAEAYAGVHVIIVTDRICGDLPENVEQLLLYGVEFSAENPFRLSWTSNIGVRRAMELGCDPVVKTDPDVYWPGASSLAKLLATTLPGTGHSPAYMMAESIEQARDNPRLARVWNATRGTLCMAAADWERMRGYDERMLGYGVEDGDLVLRALKAGILISRGSSIVYHIAHEEGSPQIRRARADWWGRSTINPDRHDHNHAVRAASIWEGGPGGTWGRVKGPAVQDV